MLLTWFWYDQNHISDQKRPNSATFGQFLSQINMERGSGAMEVAWAQSGKAQKVYQTFSHPLRYMDFIFKSQKP